MKSSKLSRTSEIQDEYRGSSILPPERTLEIDAEALMRTCPNCSAELDERQCKLICPRCHYYMSCSDYY